MTLAHAPFFLLYFELVWLALNWLFPTVGKPTESGTCNAYISMCRLAVFAHWLLTFPVGTAGSSED